MSFLARATSFLGSLHEYASTHGNLRDGNVGFWSPHTSNVDWCETNYVYTQYVAEFFNTVTSIPIFLMGVFGVVHGIRNGYRKRFLVPLTTIALIGIGSIAFHATLRKEGQAMDELSMIWGATAMLFSVIETKRDINRQWLAPALLVYLSLFTAAYLLAPADSLIFPVFLLSYSFAIIGLLFGARAYYSQIKNATVQRMLVISTICFFGSFFLFWLPDKLACAQVQRFQLHAIFHLLSSIGGWLLFTHIIFAYYDIAATEARRSKSKSKVSEESDPSPTLVFVGGALPIVSLNRNTKSS